MLRAERAYSVGDINSFLVNYSHLFAGPYLLKSEARKNFANNLLSFLSANHTKMSDNDVQILVTGMVTELEKESRNDIQTLLTLAQLHALLGEKDKAIKDVERSLVLSPKRQETIRFSKQLMDALNR